MFSRRALSRVVSSAVSTCTARSASATAPCALVSSRRRVPTSPAVPLLTRCTSSQYHKVNGCIKATARTFSSAAHDKKPTVKSSAPRRRKVVIMGALGMDFHTFDRCFRHNEHYDVLAFTVAGEQNVGTTEEKVERRYPAELAGKSLYPKGIPMIPEAQLESFVKANGVDEVVFAYSDVRHDELMHKASKALVAGADFRLISPRFNQIKSTKPIVAVCAVRTGAGKSQVSRLACRYFKDKGYKVVAIREPMPYGNLLKENVMRFAKYEDFTTNNSTIEEREEYEPYVEQGMVIYSGVDYELIVREAEKEADVIVWDGGNNEISFYVPDLLFCVTDPHRPGHENQYHPGEVNARSAHVYIINKMNTAQPKMVDIVEQNLKKMNSKAVIVKTNSTFKLSDQIKDKRVLVVEDGPTVTHGEMAYGAAFMAAKQFGATIVDPTPYLAGAIKKAFHEFPHLKQVVPAMGYNETQLKDLEQTINAANCDVILNGSPINLGRLLKCNKPIVHVEYDIEDHPDSARSVTQVLADFERQFLKK